MKDAGLEGLSTARLTLRRFRLDDEALLFQLNSSAAVMRYLAGPVLPEDNRKLLEHRILAYYQHNPGLGVWATLERSSGRCVGFHLLNNIQGEDLIQVGYRLFEADWGKGYATEMTIALLRYGYVDLGLPLLTAFAHRDNQSSRQVLLKAGLHDCGERQFSHPAYQTFGATPYFERSGSEWLAEFG